VAPFDVREVIEGRKLWPPPVGIRPGPGSNPVAGGNVAFVSRAAADEAALCGRRLAAGGSGSW
jgi:hypothetical protein